MQHFLALRKASRLLLYFRPKASLRLQLLMALVFIFVFIFNLKARKGLRVIGDFVFLDFFFNLQHVSAMGCQCFSFDVIHP